MVAEGYGEDVSRAGSHLTRYWIESDVTLDDGHPPGALLGCGVTASSEREALDLVRHHVWGGSDLPPLRSVSEDVDVSELDAEHVLLNMAAPDRRGVWFPRGFDGPAGSGDDRWTRSR